MICFTAGGSEPLPYRVLCNCSINGICRRMWDLSVCFLQTGQKHPIFAQLFAVSIDIFCGLRYLIG